ncbi:glutamate racemase [Chitinophaga horti]|uniref:Glutamate racemase n=1 Tax=Chitinophaga horti TaxID=2920382 RepID=A0ABY6J4S3_9BACT|nr:glutamate racemase [Chitinophaga horti]UYQ94673.1 glutamate racemase [Chitinophaga horti]
MHKPGPIGVFDSGYGGLTVMKELVKELPQYDYIYLGDNARAPYGTRSFDTVYHYTLECVQHLFDMGCRLVVLACNTASAKALRSIQQNDLPRIDADRRVLGVIRPTTEIVGEYTKSRQVGVMGTAGTIASESYPIEIEKFFPDITVYQQACPMWVPLVENNEWNDQGADYFVRKYIGQLLSRSPEIDTIVLGCTHYPLLINKIKRFVPEGMTILSQGSIVAHSLSDYLQRHPEMEAVCSKGGQRTFYTTDAPEGFDRQASIFFEAPVASKHLAL